MKCLLLYTCLNLVNEPCYSYMYAVCMTACLVKTFSMPFVLVNCMAKPHSTN